MIKVRKVEFSLSEPGHGTVTIFAARGQGGSPGKPEEFAIPFSEFEGYALAQYLKTGSLYNQGNLKKIIKDIATEWRKRKEFETKFRPQKMAENLAALVTADME